MGDYMRFKLMLGVTLAGVMVLTVSAWSHHAHGNYAVDTVDMEGVVTEVHLLAPHSWVYLEVTKADGTKQVWALEASSKVQLANLGVTANYIKVGDKIKARCHPLKDGGPGCLLGFVKGADGSVKDWDGINDAKQLPRDF